MTNPFEALHAGPEVLVLPNAWDAGSARVVEVAGAKAIATSSAAVAWAQGYPDGQALSFESLLADIAAIRRAVSVPLTADVEAAWAEDGAAAAENVMRVREAGAEGINIEDGTGSPDLLAAKIEAIKTRAGDSVWVNARTDVYLHRLAEGDAAHEETVRRARRYIDAGADSIFVPMAAGEPLLRSLAAAIPAPLNVLAWPGVPPLAVLRDIGVRRLSAGSGIGKVALDHVFRLARDFLAEGRSEPLTGPLAIPGGLNGNMKR
ncbi:MAG TPA: isocitrate lyase/phosphoenolpyruvate mutase family protein [Rhizomicrobium sp.]|nr:isocitrate lyase/phosphoenolpyruvate mutase family protein [Rhizomicrobium sp.]